MKFTSISLCWRIRADIQRRASNYEWSLAKWAKESNYPFSFLELERNHTAKNQQPFPYWDGIPHHDVGGIAALTVENAHLREQAEQRQNKEAERMAQEIIKSRQRQ